ncbi:Alpha/Beta hydrolase protein [Trichoderma austrokoningii]
MKVSKLRSLLFFILCLATVSDAAAVASSAPTPFKVDLSSRVPHMLDLIQTTILPTTEDSAAINSFNLTQTTGLPLTTLASLQNEWVNGFNWKTEEDAMNKYKIGSQTVHFIHQKSSDPNAIPIILLHRWPGSFLELIPLLDQLILSSSSQSFHVVVPSLPGFGFSSPTPKDWTIANISSLFNTLMTQVLGYKTYALHGTDWGSGVSFDMYDSFNATVKAAHFAVAKEERAMNFQAKGAIYFAEMATRPNTLGLALYDNPIGQLSWLAEKFILCKRGTGPSRLTNNEILKHVSLYYLSKTFITAAYIYEQNPTVLSNAYLYRKAKTSSPLLFTDFPYNIQYWPKETVASVGNLMYYSSVDFGGHFPALDNVAALAEDVRQIGKYYK